MPSSWTRRGFLGAAGAAVVSTAPAAAEPAAAAPGGKIKILAISGSHRKGMTTATGLQACLEAAQAVSPRIEVELIELAGLSIDGAVAAGMPPAPGQPDDFLPLIPKLTDPRLWGIIIGTPVYFGSMSSRCKAFLERWTAFKKEYPFSNKVGGVLAVGGGRNGGQELTIQGVQAALMAQEMLIVGDGRPTSHRGATLWNDSKTKGGVAADTWGLTTAKDLGRRVAEVALRMAGSAGT